MHMHMHMHIHIHIDTYTYTYTYTFTYIYIYLYIYIYIYIYLYLCLCLCLYLYLYIHVYIYIYIYISDRFTSSTEIAPPSSTWCRNHSGMTAGLPRISRKPMVLPFKISGKSVESHGFIAPNQECLQQNIQICPDFCGKPCSVVIFNILGPIPRGDILSSECTSSAPIYSWKGPNSCG